MIKQLKEEVASIDLKHKEAEDKITESNKGLADIETKKAKALDETAKKRKAADDQLAKAVEQKEVASS